MAAICHDNVCITTFGVMMLLFYVAQGLVARVYTWIFSLYGAPEQNPNEILNLNRKL